MKNRMELTFMSVSENEAFARSTVAAFISQLNPTLDELTDIKTVVSEAVTNAIIHGYNNKPDSEILISCEIYADHEIEITISDTGEGIGNIYQAKEPLYTSKPELERSGMGFSIMESFMDALTIHSTIGEGTTIVMKKQLTRTQTACH